MKNEQSFLYIPLSGSKNREGKEAFDLENGVNRWLENEKKF